MAYLPFLIYCLYTTLKLRRCYKAGQNVAKKDPYPGIRGRVPNLKTFSKWLPILIALAPFQVGGKGLNRQFVPPLTQMICPVI